MLSRYETGVAIPGRGPIGIPSSMVGRDHPDPATDVRVLTAVVATMSALVAALLFLGSYTKHSNVNGQLTSDLAS
jgi:multisubunit Na+/H+ antiporter MnhC subunit